MHTERKCNMEHLVIANIAVEENYNVFLFEILGAAKRLHIYSLPIHAYMTYMTRNGCTLNLILYNY